LREVLDRIGGKVGRRTLSVSVRATASMHRPLSVLK
jgi:hypothetical protein